MAASAQKDPVFGIDLGTSNCCVSLWVNGQATIVRNAQGDRTTPSVVAIGADGAILVGAPAHRQAVMNPTKTVSEVKRLVGLAYHSPAVRAARQVLPYEIVSAANGDAWAKIDERWLSPQELQAYILEQLMAAGSNFIGAPASRAVITVPAFFDETQRQAVRDAAQIAGIKLERLLSEPTAAALAYGYAQLDKRRIAVVDLGGGTLDVTIMSVEEGKFEVLATDGDNLLGGADFDRALALHFLADIKAKHGIELGADPVAMQRLLAESENAKKVLTQQQTCDISLPYLARHNDQPINFEYRLSLEQYEKLVAPLTERIAAPCRAAVGQAGLRLAELDDVILIGGMTRSPVVRQKVTELFERKPLLRVNPDEAVAMGAALLGASISGEMAEVGFVDVVPRSIGLRAAGDKYVTLIKKSAQLPARCSKAFRTTEDNQKIFSLEVLQGESDTASENRRLSRVNIDLLSHKPAGEVILEVEFVMESSGSLTVSSKERGTTEQSTVLVEPFSGLTASQVERLAAEHESARPKFSKVSSAEPSLGGFSIDFASTSTKPATEKIPVVNIAAHTKPNSRPATRTSSAGSDASKVPAKFTTQNLDAVNLFATLDAPIASPPSPPMSTPERAKSPSKPGGHAPPSGSRSSTEPLVATSLAGQDSDNIGPRVWVALGVLAFGGVIAAVLLLT